MLNKKALSGSKAYTKKIFDISGLKIATAGRNMERTFVENGVIKPRTKRVRDSFLSSSGGLREIEVSNYDGFVVCGMGLGVARLLL